MKSTSISQSSIVRTLIVDPDKVDKNLMCLICKEFVVVPRECSQCQNLFCLECITIWLQYKKTCPNKCSQQLDLKDPHRMFKNQISQILLKCVNKGCDIQIELQFLDSHLKDCEYVETKCPHHDCNLIDCLKSIKVHQQTCQHRTQTCQKCELTNKINQQHDCIETLRKKIKLQEDNNLHYQQKTDNIIMGFASRLEQLETISKCLQGHQLKWVIPPKIMQCKKCKEKDVMVRFICERCSIGYCQKCKMPDFIGQRCPVQHVLQQDQFHQFQCQFCGEHKSTSNVRYRDSICDFTICFKCCEGFTENEDEDDDE